MKFLVDRCVGRRVLQMSNNGYSANWSWRGAVVIGLVLPSTLVEDAINLHGQDLEQRAIVTIQGGRTRVSRPDTI